MAVFTDDFNRPDTAAWSGLGTMPGGPAWEVVAGSWRIASYRAYSDTSAASSPIAVVDGASANVDLTAGVSRLGGDAVYVRVVDADNWIRARVRRWQTTESYTTYVTEYEWRAPAYDIQTDEYTGTVTGWGSSLYPGYPIGSAVGDTYSNQSEAFKTGDTRQVPETSYYTDTHYQVVLEKCVAGSVQALGTTSVPAPSQVRLRAVGQALKVYVNGSASESISTTDATHADATRHGIGRGPSDLTGTALDDVTIDTLNSPPHAPTVTVPDVADISRPLTVGIGFNDPDTDDTPSAARIRFRPSGDATPPWTEQYRPGRVSTVTIPADTFTAGIHEVQGQSTDSGGKIGPWSSSQFFTAAEPPAAPSFVIPVNGATIPAEDFIFEIVHPGLDPWEWRVLADDGTGDTPDETNVLTPITAEPGSTRTATAAGLVDNTIVHLQSRAIENGLTSGWVTSTNPVSYTRPADPTVDVEENYPTDAVSLQATHPTPTGFEPTVTSVDWHVRVADIAGARPVGERTVGGDGIRLSRLAGLAPTAVAVDWAVASGVEYEYRCRAHGDNGTSAYSEWTSAGQQPEGDETAPSVPSDVSATATGETTATVTWTASADDESGQSAIRYRVRRGGSVVATTAAGATSFDDAGLTGGTTYSYTVTAVDEADNESAQSAADTATTDEPVTGALGLAPLGTSPLGGTS